MSLRRIVKYWVFIGILSLPALSIAQKTETILAHKKGTHSIGGIYLFLPVQTYPRSIYHHLNFRYSYAIKDRWEIGLNLGLGYQITDNLYYGNKTKDHYLNFVVSPFARYYLGKSRFGAFIEGGFKTRFYHSERHGVGLFHPRTESS